MAKRTRAKFLIFSFLGVMILDLGADEVVSRFVSALGVETYDAKKSAENVFGFVTFIESLLLAAILTRVAIANGRQRFLEAGMLIKLGVAASFFYGVVAMCVLLPLENTFLLLSSGSAQLDETASAYYVVKAIALPVTFMVNTCFGAALGLMELPILLASTVLGCLIQVSSAALFLFAFRTGLVGDAIAVAAGEVGLCGFMLWKLRTERRLAKLWHKTNADGGGDALLEEEEEEPDAEGGVYTAMLDEPPTRTRSFRQLLKSFVSYNSFLLVYECCSNLTWLLNVPLYSRLGRIPLAAMGAIGSMRSIVGMVAVGLGTALNMMCAMFYSRGSYEAIQFFLRRAARIVVPVLVFSVIITIVAPAWFIGLFYKDPSPTVQNSVVATIMPLLPIVISNYVVKAAFDLYSPLMYGTDSYKFMAAAGFASFVVVYASLAGVGYFVQKSLAMVYIAQIAFHLVVATAFMIRYHLVQRPKFQRAEMKRAEERGETVVFGKEGYRKALMAAPVGCLGNTPDHL